MRDEGIANAAFGRTAFQGRIGFCGQSFPAQNFLILSHFLRSTGVHLIGKCFRAHDRAILTYLYARRRIGVAVKGDHYRLREPLPPEAEEALTPFRNFVRFVEAKRDGVKYDPNQPRVPAGNPDGGQWTAEGGTSAGDDSTSDSGRDGGDGGDSSADHSGNALPIQQVGFTKEERMMTAQEFISENCDASILRVFPSEYLDWTVGDIAGMPHSNKKTRCMKLLSRKRYKK